ncbi:MAG TPA: CHRD domain-containing protein [Burkholderiales bacterium]|nr:CHRD domain-containing protein [Burkholderiales bacterium]
MNNVTKATLLGITVLALGACATYQEHAPSWMPGSGAVSVKLSGAEEVPPVNVPGSGSGSFRLAEDGSLSGSVTTKDVPGTMAHIHQGAKGQNGPVIVPLDKKGDTYSVPAGRKLTPAQIEAWKAGNLYVNVHSDRNKGGEVRAQIAP